MNTLQNDLFTLEQNYCTCRRLTTSDNFWLGDHEPTCQLVLAITAVPDDLEPPLPRLYVHSIEVEQ